MSPVGFGVETSERHPLLHQVKVRAFGERLANAGLALAAEEQKIGREHILGFDVPLQELLRVAARLKHDGAANLSLGLHWLHLHLVAHLA